MDAIGRSVLLLLAAVLVQRRDVIAIKIGAVFRNPEDLHLSQTFRWAVDWSRKHMYSDPKIAEFLEYKIEYVTGKAFEHFVAQKVCKLANEGAIAIFSGADLRMSRVVRNVADHLNLLYFNIVWDHEAEKDALNFFPDPQKFVQAFEDLILYWRWPRVVIVYEDPSTLGRLEYLLTSEKLNQTKVSVIRVEKRDFVSAMRKVKYSGIKHVIVDFPTGLVKEALLAALEVGIISHHYWFLVTSLDFYCLDLEYFRHNHGRICGFTVVNNSTISESPVFGYIQDYMNSTSNFPATEIALMFDAVYAYARGIDNASRLLFEENPSVKARCEPYGPYQAHPLGSTFFNYISHAIARDNGLTGSLKFRGNYREALQLEIYQLGYDGAIDTIGTWNSSGKLVQMDNESAVPYTVDALIVNRAMAVPHLRVTTLIEQPYMQLKVNHYEHQGNDRYEGFCVDLLKILSQDLGFTYTIQVVKDGKYGQVNGSGHWDGMVGDLLNNQSDMAVAPLTITYTRAAVVDFTTPFLSFGIGVLLRIPQVQRPGLFSFMKPLSGHIWMSILVAGLVTTVLAYIIARITPYEWRAPRSLCAVGGHPREAYFGSGGDEDNTNVLVNNYTLANSAWYVMTTYLKGCAHFAPKSISTRLLGGFWWVFCLVIISAYTANLAAVLTVDRRFLPIKSLDDLAYQNEISFGAIVDGSTAQFFNESRLPAHRAMWERMASNPSVFVKTISEGLQKVLTENYAFLMESSSLEYLVAKECNLTPVGAVLGSNGYGIALRKGARWTDDISRLILNYGEKGKIEQIKTEWWKARASCQQSVSATMKEERVALNMDSVAGLFLILLAGLCLAVLLGILEFILKNKENADIEQRSIWAEMAHELCLAFRTPRSSRRHQIHRRCSRCDVSQTTAQPAQLSATHRSRRIAQHPSIENNIKSHHHHHHGAGCSSTSGGGGGGPSVVQTLSSSATMKPLTGSIRSKFGGEYHRRAHSASGPHNRPPSSPYYVARHRVDADVIEFQENGKLLDHHETATTVSSLSRCSTQDRLTASCAYGLPNMR